MSLFDPVPIRCRCEEPKPEEDDPDVCALCDQFIVDPDALAEWQSEVMAAVERGRR